MFLMVFSVPGPEPVDFFLFTFGKVVPRNQMESFRIARQAD
jgi:hypothetical protein